MRRCLDSHPGALPDLREAISQVTGLLNTTKFPDFPWTEHVLHGDPHAGNVASTRQGSRWLDFESACAGPVERDLSALPEGSRVLTHDPARLTHLIRLRRVCVVAWCASKTHANVAENTAIAYHLAIIRAEASG